MIEATTAPRANNTRDWRIRFGAAMVLAVDARRAEARPYKILRSLLFLGLVFLAAPVQAAIHYTVSLEHPEQHLFHVTMEIPDVSGEVLVAMPAWNALYQVRDFAMHVQRVEALVDKKPVPIEKVDKQTWKITAIGTVSVRYDTFWNDGGPFGTELNADSAFINPAMILMYVPQRRAEEVRVALNSLPSGWEAERARGFT